MKLGEALGILLVTAIGVGFCSFLGGTLFMSSVAIEGYAETFDDMGDAYADMFGTIGESYAGVLDIVANIYYSFGDYDNANEMRDAAAKMRNDASQWSIDIVREMRDSTTEMRNAVRESHDYGVYFIVGALLIVVAGAGWMAWKFQKKND